MNLFYKLMRNTGLLVHGIMQPIREDAQKRKVISQRVEEEKISEEVTLRRTIVEEVEIRRQPPPSDSK